MLLGSGDLTEKARKRDTFLIASALRGAAPVSVNVLTLVLVFPQEAAQRGEGPRLRILWQTLPGQHAAEDAHALSHRYLVTLPNSSQSIRHL